MLSLEASFHIDFSFPDNEILNQALQEIRHKYNNFTYNIKYILIETKFTDRLLKKKDEYIYRNLRKELENNPEIRIVETDLEYDPKVKNVPIVKDIDFYKLIMKNFNGYVAFKYSGPLEQIKSCIDYLRNFNYCYLCTIENIYQINLYSLKDLNINFVYVKVFTGDVI